MQLIINITWILGTWFKLLDGEDEFSEAIRLDRQLVVRPIHARSPLVKIIVPVGTDLFQTLNSIGIFGVL